MNARWGAREAPSRRTTPGVVQSAEHRRLSREGAGFAPRGRRRARSVFTATSNGAANVGSCHVARWTVPSRRPRPGVRRPGDATRERDRTALPSASATLRASVSASASAFDASATVAKTHPAVEGETILRGARAAKHHALGVLLVRAFLATACGARHRTRPGRCTSPRPHHRRRPRRARPRGRRGRVLRRGRRRGRSRIASSPGVTVTWTTRASRTRNRGRERRRGRRRRRPRWETSDEEGGERGGGRRRVRRDARGCRRGDGRWREENGRRRSIGRDDVGDRRRRLGGFARGSSASASRWARSRSGSHGAPSRVTEETRAGVRARRARQRRRGRARPRRG